jgi:hypothetical protein
VGIFFFVLRQGKQKDVLFGLLLVLPFFFNVLEEIEKQTKGLLNQKKQVKEIIKTSMVKLINLLSLEKMERPKQ